MSVVSKQAPNFKHYLLHLVNSFKTFDSVEAYEEYLNSLDKYDLLNMVGEKGICNLKVSKVLKINCKEQESCTTCIKNYLISKYREALDMKVLSPYTDLAKRFRRGGACCKCKSENIDFTGVNIIFEDDIIEVEYYCKDCGIDMKVTYKIELMDIQEIKK